MDQILTDIRNERQRQKQLAHGGDTDAFDKTNAWTDWLAYTMAYLGRAADKVTRNEREGQDFRDNLVTAGALIVAAIEAHDKEYC